MVDVDASQAHPWHLYLSRTYETPQTGVSEADAYAAVNGLRLLGTHPHGRRLATQSNKLLKDAEPTAKHSVLVRQRLCCRCREHDCV
eukprot:scaffold197058_cov30-Tisochrysis_lutea.AAC.2